MPELRKDPIVDRWVIIAPERADRPHEFLRAFADPDLGSCPFCPGNEALTPPELLVQRPAGGPRNGPGWTLRVVPNRFPALRTEIQMSRSGSGLFDRMAGVGAHEVIIETADHKSSLARLPVAQVQGVLSAWAERMIDLSRDERLRCAIVFKNAGSAAGATLSHPHSQLVALPLLPGEQRAEMEAARAWFELKERCIWCDLLALELSEKTRIVAETDGYVACAPYASRSPFEVHLLPREHRCSYERSSAAELEGLAMALRTVLRKLDVALEEPALNFFLHTLPLREPYSPWYHWHLELKPTLTTPGGFEWATGCYINPTPPEEAAGFLRQTEV